MKYYSILIIALVVLLSGCGTPHNEGVSTDEDRSYLYFSGDTTDVSITIDGGDLFDVQSGQKNLYTIDTGTRKVSVFRSGILIMEREIFVSKGISKEIQVK